MIQDDPRFEGEGNATSMVEQKIRKRKVKCLMMPKAGIEVPHEQNEPQPTFVFVLG